MAGKKTNAPKAPAKAAKRAAPKPIKAEKPGALGSLKKMLGLGGAKSSVAAKPTAAAAKTQAKAMGKSRVAPAGGKPAASAKTAQPAQPAAPVVAGKRGAKGAKPAAPAVMAPKGAPAGKKGAGKGGPLSELRAGGLRAHEPVASTAPVCREVACELMATTGGYCRMHYIKNWKKIKRKEMILKERKLNGYIEELVSKYPDKYIEAIRQDLASEKDFAKVIADLEIDEGLDDFESVETETAEGLIDNIKREFDDEGDVF